MKNRNTLLYTVIAVGTLLVAIIGVTFAYFQAQAENNGTSKVEVQTSSTDTLIYTAGQKINIIATQQNFYNNGPDLVGTTNGTVQLTANNMEPTSYCYTVDLIINSNEFVYTVNSSTPELLLTISKSKAGGVAQNLYLNYDMTTATGTIHIPNIQNGGILTHMISANPSQVTTDAFTASITFKNLASDQQQNTNKNLDAELVFTTISC